MPGGPWLSGIGNQLVVGAAGGPQVILDSTLSLAVTTSMPGSAAPAADVSSISNLQNVVRMPTGVAGEVSPSIMGPVKVTYTNAEIADGLLILSGFLASAAKAYFQLYLSGTLSKPGGMIAGDYHVAGTTITLSPSVVMDTPTGAMGLYTPLNVVYALNLTGANLIPNPDGWQALPLVNGWTGTARFKALPDGRVELDVALSSAAATAFQFSTIPLAYLPLNTVYIAAGATANVATGVSPYIQVVSTGVLNMEGLHAFSTAGIFVAGGSYPRD